MTTRSIDFKEAVIRIVDGSNTPNEVEVLVGEGNLTWSEKKPRIYDKDRGKLGSVRNGDEMPLELSLQARWITLKSTSGVVSIYEALKKIGRASAWESTDDDTCAPYAVNIEMEITPICEDEDIELIVFPDFRYEDMNPDPKAATLSISGMCNVTEPTITRSAQP